MNYLTITVGILVFLFGIYSGIMWFMKPQLFKKLEPMRKKWGTKVGSIWHFTGYVIIPITFGLLVLVLGFCGRNLFEVFN